MLDFLSRMLRSIMEGNMKEVYTLQNISYIQSETMRLIGLRSWGDLDMTSARIILNICNIVYNNTDAMCPLEDGVYDTLLELYKMHDPNNYQVGGEVVRINNEGREVPVMEEVQPIWAPITAVDPKVADGLFYENLVATPPLDFRLFDRQIDRNDYEKNTRETKSVPHKYPKLVGTLDKCKFVLMREAIEAGVADDPAVKVFERDFLGKHLMEGVINRYQEITLLLELKYDGMSVEADVTDHIISARSRGDTNADRAEDLTPVLKGYPFYNCNPIPDEESFGMKFEAIITKANLEKMARLKGKPYKNGRNGIVGLMKSIDAYAYRDLITLVPLETSLDIGPITEVEFMNKYYNSGVYLKYAVVKGNYEQVLFQVYQFVKEAQAIRDIMPFMYDGVVVHYVDPAIRQRLGRVNSVNKYSIAIKFTPTTKEAIFLGYSFTIGQNGDITPMIHYTPVEFFGTIHTKSSGHSLQRFNELDLSVGEVINVTYVNDVMPYVSKPYQAIEYIKPSTAKIQFPTVCPCCGSPLVISESGRTARCPNTECPERVISRLTNMVDKLNIKGFSEAALRAMNVTSFRDFISINRDRAVNALGEVNGDKFMTLLQEFLTTPIYDYRIVGSLGFTGIAIETWKKIFSNITLDDLLNKSPSYLYDLLIRIKGVGTNIATIITTERSAFYNDLVTIYHMPNLVSSYNMKPAKSIRFTGCRDADLEKYLVSRGYDCNSKASVTKTTNILLVPEIGFNSEKTRKAGDATQIIQIDEFKKNIDYYLS